MRTFVERRRHFWEKAAFIQGNYLNSDNITLNIDKHLNLISTSRPQKSHTVSTDQLNQWIIEGIRDKKGKNIVQLDLRKLDDAPADFFIICEGDSNTHVKSISDSVYKKVKDELHTMPTHVEGSGSAKWVLMDYFDTVVHVFYPETRQFYELEQLWSDAKMTEFAEV